MTYNRNDQLQRLMRWNPFREFDTEAEARRAARWGAGPAGFLALLWAAGLAGRLMIARVGAISLASLLVLGVAPLVVLGGLAWRVWARQGRWSAIGVAVMVGLKVLSDLLALATHRGAPPDLFLLLVVTGTTIASVRGSWRLHAMRGRAGADLTVFE